MKSKKIGVFATFLMLITRAAWAQAAFETESLKMVPLTPHTYRHISYIQTDTWGKVDCNGLVVISEGEALVFDTPVSEAASEALIGWIKTELKAKVIGVVATHFHEDCLGGLPAFHKLKVPSYGIGKTLALATKSGVEAPVVALAGQSSLPVGSTRVQLSWPGPGHTEDNIVAYFAEDRVLFGGCLVKASGAGKGFLGDADVAAWPETVQQVKDAYPRVQVVVPGHGEPGGPELLDYTRELFKKGG